MSEPAVDVHFPYTPRWYQQEFERAMFDGKRFAYLLYHRRAGKDIACFNFLVNEAFKRVGLYVYALPDYTQAKKVIWQGIDEDGHGLLEYIPEPLIAKTNATDLRIDLINGSSIQIVGAKTYDSFRGAGVVGCVLSEYAYQHPALWDRVLEPMIGKTNGFAIFNTTPNGKNHAYDMWNFAVQEEEWFTQKLTIGDTGLISQKQVERERRRGKPEEVIQQEYYCDWSSGAVGTYYAKLFGALWDHGKITNVPADDAIPVYTAWDLGIGDSTSIWWFQLLPGGEIHFIDYFEDSGEPLSYYAKIVKGKDYCYEDHFFPHDVMARELGTGASRFEMLRELGLYPTVTARLALDDGIQTVRSILPRCYFDKEKCSMGVKHLENYRKRWSDSLMCFVEKPLHNEASHASDAFRMAAINIVSGLGKQGITENDAERMWQTYASGV